MTSISIHTKPLCATHELELGRLGDDRRVGPHVPQDLLHAEARVLLVGDGRDDHVARKPEPSRASRQATSAAASPAFMS